ncbi:MAG: hypothetical protein RM338_07315 [Nostoc sp. DedQUE12a]|nr:hypothetical protein [Nostoc sp. DedQUE12a]
MSNDKALLYKFCLAVSVFTPQHRLSFNTKMLIQQKTWRAIVDSKNQN